MRRLGLPIVLALLLLGGCVGPGGLSGGLTADQSMAIACRGYGATLAALAPYKARMNTEDVQSVNAGVLVLSPLCRAAALGEVDDYAKALAAVRNELRRMLILERELKG